MGRGGLLRNNPVPDPIQPDRERQEHNQPPPVTGRAQEFSVRRPLVLVLARQHGFDLPQLPENEGVVSVAVGVVFA